MEINSGNILVTGSAGYVGSALCNLLDKKNIDYLAVDKITVQKKKHVTCDLANKEHISDILIDYNPDIIYHCGTYSAGDYSKDFFNSYTSDSFALINILNFINQSSKKVKLIFFSSSYVYSGLSSRKSVDESMKLTPIHNFGISKYFFERLIMSNNIDSLIFRMSNVFGPGNQANITAINSWLNNSSEKNNDLVIWGEGNRKIQYIHIDDLMSVLFQVHKISRGIYNLGGTEYLSMNKVAELISEKYDNKIVHLYDKNEGETLPFMNVDLLLSILNKQTFKQLEELI